MHQWIKADKSPAPRSHNLPHCHHQAYIHMVFSMKPPKKVNKQYYSSDSTGERYKRLIEEMRKQKRDEGKAFGAELATQANLGITEHTQLGLQWPLDRLSTFPCDQPWQASPMELESAWLTLQLRSIMSAQKMWWSWICLQMVPRKWRIRLN